jgi:hypothetical protein
MVFDCSEVDLGRAMSQIVCDAHVRAVYHYTIRKVKRHEDNINERLAACAISGPRLCAFAPTDLAPAALSTARLIAIA